MLILSCGVSAEHASPSWKIETKHLICSLLIFLLASSPVISPQRANPSTISIIWSGNASLTKRCRVTLSWNSLSAGLFPVKIPETGSHNYTNLLLRRPQQPCHTLQYSSILATHSVKRAFETNPSFEVFVRFK